MKKFVIVVATLGIGLMASSLWAACVGPFCWDDTGASVNATLSHNGPAVNYSQTKAQIALRSPKASGEMIFCSDCTSKDTLCISTGTAKGGYGHITSTSTACN